MAITRENNFSEFLVYSINGKSLLKQKEENDINFSVIIRDINTINYFLYILKNSVVIKSLPDLNKENCVEGINYVYSIYSSDDIKNLYGINK